MARTTEVEVEAAIDTDVTSADIGGFIDDANAWVTTHLTGKDLSTATLTQIEKYLACHLITLRDPRVRSARRGDIRETYQRDTEVTEYLKWAAGLDETGTVEDRLMPGGRQKLVFRVGEGYDDDLDLPETDA